MTTGMAQVQSRVSELAALMGLQPAGVLGGSAAGTSSASGSDATGSASSAEFAGALADALGGAAGSTGSTGTGGAATGARVVALAQTYDGVPYRWGGSDPATGLDCSGLTQLVLGRLGVTLPRIAADQARSGVAVPSLAQAEPGDLVFFGSPAHHVGIYAGAGKMIDAPHSGATVGLHPVSGYGPVSAVRRVLPQAAAGAVAGPTARQSAALSSSALSSSALSSSALSSSALSSSALLSAVGLPGLAGRTGATSGTTRFADLFAAAGQRHGVDPALLAAVAKVESGGNPAAVSPAGARGLMQLMPATARSLGVDPDDPAQAVDGAARLLSGLLSRFGGRVDEALAGYNAGPGAVQRYGGVPPYPETQAYVQKVTSNWKASR